MLSKGIVFFSTQSGRINTTLLKSHKTESSFEGKSSAEVNHFAPYHVPCLIRFVLVECHVATVSHPQEVASRVAHMRLHEG